jgi:hypothetical protein
MDRSKKFLLCLGVFILLLITGAFAFALYTIRQLELEKNRYKTAPATAARKKIQEQIPNGQAVPGDAAAAIQEVLDLTKKTDEERREEN